MNCGRIISRHDWIAVDSSSCFCFAPISTIHSRLLLASIFAIHAYVRVNNLICKGTLHTVHFREFSKIEKHVRSDGYDHALCATQEKKLDRRAGGRKCKSRGTWALYIWRAILAGGGGREKEEEAKSAGMSELYWKREAKRENQRDKARSMYMDYQKGRLGIPIRHSRLTRRSNSNQPPLNPASRATPVSCIELPPFYLTHRLRLASPVWRWNDRGD